MYLAIGFLTVIVLTNISDNLIEGKKFNRMRMDGFGDIDRGRFRI
jgi:hypothetical protein